MNDRIKNISLSLLPGILLYLAWPPRDLSFLAFIAFLPFFILEYRTRAKKGFFLGLYTGMIVFNALNTWWVWYASPGGSIAMLLANSLLMSIPFLLYRKTVKQFGQGRALFAFITYWLAFEYLHLNWEITWPWLSLGNVFAKHSGLIQWYEYTGMLGGSLWVLWANVLAFKLWLAPSRKRVTRLSFALLIPALLSLAIWNKEVNNTAEVETEKTLIVQPNIDPYLKFDRTKEVSNFAQMLKLIETQLTEDVSYVVLPETAIVEYLDEDYFNGFQSIKLLSGFMQRHPGLHLITGASTYNFYDPDEERKSTARATDDGRYYESYNTSMEVDKHGIVELYHKSKLVPGVEKMPYPSIFSFLEYWSIDMGGVTGSLGENERAEVFKAGDKPDLAPLICYESVFPGYVREFVQAGADIILVMTNDGWWKDTDGYKQHMYYAKLRAIENRREVLRSANTGISCRIDIMGEIHERTNWWEEAVLTVDVRVHRKQTFYTKYGDYIGRFGAFFAVFLMLGVFVKSRIKE